MERRVLVVEDDPFVGGLLHTSLQANGFEAQVVTTALDAKSSMISFEPDIALLDVDLGDGPNGIELMSFLVRVHPEVAVVLMTDRSAITQGLTLPDGVAFLLKSKISNPSALIDALESTVRGQGALTRHADDGGEVAELSRTQREVLRLIAMGFSNARIAEERGITLSGAEQAVRAIIRKLGIRETADVSPRVEAARRYIASRGMPRRPQ